MNTRGTIVLDRMCGSLGRVRLATGTHNKGEAATLNGVLSELMRTCDWATIRRLQSHELTIAQVGYAKMRGEALPQVEDTTLVWPAMAEWVEQLDAKASSKEFYRGIVRTLAKAYPTATVSRLADVLAEDRVKRIESDTRARWNLFRAVTLQFVREVYGKRHAVAFAIADLKRLKEDRRPRNPLTVEQMRSLVARLPEDLRSDAWGMFLTGMRPRSEWYAGTWSVESDRIVIRGTKTDAATRIIPRPYPVARPRGTYERLARALDKLTDLDVTPHDFRSSAMCLWEDARIARTRRQIYLGHRVSDVSELYERRRSVEPYLVEDAEAIRRFLGEAPMAVGLAVVG